MFGSNAGTGLFNTPQTSLGRGLGLNSGSSTGGGLFNRQSGGLFGNTGTTGGLGNQGGGLFGQTPVSQGSGLFGQSGLGGGGLTGNSSSLFQTPQSGGLGMQQKTGGLFGQSPMLGGSSSGSNAIGSGLLGQNSVGGAGGLFNKTQTSGTGILGGGIAQSSGFFNPGLGGVGAAGGSTIKYDPVKGTDTVTKNGLSVTITTYHHCITSSSHYSNKSMEELRFEDYTAGRKGPSSTTGTLSGGLFGSGGGLGGTTGGIFGQNKTLGATGNTLGGGLLGGVQNPGQMGLGLGSTSTSGGLFGNQQQLKLGGGGLFGNNTLGGGGGGILGGAQNQGQLGLGLGANTSTSGGLFGNQQQKLGAGGGLFGNTSTQNKIGGLGGNLGTGGLFGQQQTSQAGGGLFGNTGGMGLFNQQAAAGSQLGTGLGGAQTQLAGGLGGGGLFKNNPQLGRSGLGQTQPGGVLSLGLGGLGGGTGGGLNLGGGNLTGLGGNKLTGTLMGTGGATGLGRSGLGVLGQTGNLGTTSLQQQQQQQLQLKQQQLEVLANSPFGDSPLFRTALYDATKMQKNKATPTMATPKTSPSNMPHYKLSLRPSAKLTTTSLSSPGRHKEKNRLFEGLEDSPHSTTPTLSGGNSLGMGVAGSGGEVFVPRKSVKKLNIRPKPSQSHTWPDSTTPPVEEEQVAPSPIVPTSVAGGVAAVKGLKRSPLARVEEEVALEEGSYVAKGGVREQSGGVAGWTGAEGEDEKEASFIAEEEEADVTRHCGVVLSDPSYYTVPPLDECDSMTSGTTCVVANFTIGRRDIGEIYYPGNTDIYGLNLDKIVKIVSREVVVYPDDLPDPKPAVGEELNKPAIVSMHGFWPKDKQTHTPIKDRERLVRMNYTKKLQGLVEKIGGSFVDYKPDTGTCEFEVRHFSKYRLDGDDSDDDENEGRGEGEKKEQENLMGVVKKPRTATQVSRDSHVPLPLQPIQPPPTAQPVSSMQPPLSSSQPLPPSQSTLSIAADDDSMSGDDEFEDAYEEVRLAGSRQLPLAPPQQLVGASTQHIQLMKMSFFSEEEAQKTPMFPSAPTTSTRSPHFSATQRTKLPLSPRSILIHRKHQPHVPLPSTPTPSTPRHSSFTSVLGHQQQQQRHSPAPSSGRHTSSSLVQSAILMSKQDLKVLVPAKHCLQTSKERCLADHALFLGRSFRVGWGPNWTLFHSGIQAGSSSTQMAASHSSVFSQRLSGFSSAKKGSLPIRVVVEKFTNVAKETDLFEPFLLAQLENTVFSDDSDSGAPLCFPKEGTTLLTALSEVTCSQDLLPPAQERGEGVAWQQLERVLQLLVVLWGDLPDMTSPDVNDYIHQMTRKHRVAKWLRETNKPVTDEEVSKSTKSEEQYLKSLFSLVAGQQIPAACQLAQQKKDHKLALLLSHATSLTEMNKMLLRKQLEMWEEHGAHHHIHPIRLKLYVLLAGVMRWTWRGSGSDDLQDWELQTMETNTNEGLDWKRSLALHLNFGCELNSHLVDAMDKYARAFKDEEPPYAPPPHPPHVEQQGKTPLVGKVSFDSCYHLLRLYCERSYPMENISQPTASSSNPLDYRTCWIVWSVLTALGYTHMHKTSEAQVMVGVANQLSAQGKWQWGVFSLLHLQDPVLRRSSVEQFLSRHCSPKKKLTKAEEFVLERLGVPHSWVYAAKAQHAGYEEWHDLRASHLLSSGQWNEAHTVILEHLAVDAIVNGESKELMSMLQTLKSHESHVFGWDDGGSVFLDFLFISEKIEKLVRSQSEPTLTNTELDSYLDGLKLLAGRISLLPATSPRQVLCRSEIAKQTLNYTRAVVELKAASMKLGSGYIVDEVSTCVKQIPLPPDFALTEYHALQSEEKMCT